MLDTTLPNERVLMRNPDIRNVPEVGLPEGYVFRMFQPTYDEAREWARLTTEAGLFPSIDWAMNVFSRDFGAHPEDMRARILFIETDAGEKAASAAAWYGILNGVRLPRLHYVAVRPSHEGRGLARPLLGRAMAIFRGLGEYENVFLLTTPRNYQAIGIYRSLGFRAYHTEPFDVYNFATRVTYDASLWAIIDEKLAQRP